MNQVRLTNMEPVLGDLVPNTLCERDGALPSGFRQNGNELFSTVARYQIHGSHAALKQSCHRRENAVAGDMPVSVIDELEVVEIDKEHRQRGVVPPDALYLSHQANRQSSTVDEL